MSKMWQKLMMFAVSLILGIILITQVRTKTNLLGSISIGDRTAQLSEELTELNLEKNRLREELESLKQKNKEYEELYQNAQEEFLRLSEELEVHKIISGKQEIISFIVYVINAKNNNYSSRNKSCCADH
jgi:cell shape-determining protein MreC